MPNKIQTICTIGPACEQPAILEQMILAGMDIARINFSHASYDEYIQRKAIIQEYNILYGKNVKMLMDLQGPRMRVGTMPPQGRELTVGEEVLFSTAIEDTNAIHINDPYLHEDIQIDHPLYLANGDLELTVIGIEGQTIKTKVVRGGILHSRKGINVPETNVTTGGLTEKDLEDIAFGVEQGVDYIAMSFVKDAEEIEKLRSIVNNPAIKLVAKIERKQALHNINEIIKAVDVIMIARGDLGIELPIETLPLIQKDIIRRCIAYDKPAIVATQMLMSMVDHPRPTRAEVSDVANAVLDGAKFLMLSDETAFGNYPVESLEYLVKTSRHVEAYQFQQAAAQQEA